MTSSQSQFSPGYAIALDRVREEIIKMDTVRTRSRCFSLYGIQKAIGEPRTAEGMGRTRIITEMALKSLVEESMIISYAIRPRFDGGPEWA